MVKTRESKTHESRRRLIGDPHLDAHRGNPDAKFSILWGQRGEESMAEGRGG